MLQNIKNYCILIFLLISVQGFSQNIPLYEKDYSDYIQTLIGGQREVSIDGGRVDLVTEEYAIEIEWASKWKEAIGQSLWYALNTSKKPAIVLIIQDASEYKYLIQLNSALAFGNLSEAITVFAFPNDFQEIMDK